MMCCRVLCEMDDVRTNFGPFESASSAGLGTAMLPITLTLSIRLTVSLWSEAVKQLSGSNSRSQHTAQVVASPSMPVWWLWMT